MLPCTTTTSPKSMCRRTEQAHKNVCIAEVIVAEDVLHELRQSDTRVTKYWLIINSNLSPTSPLLSTISADHYRYLLVTCHRNLSHQHFLPSAPKHYVVDSSFLQTT